MSDLFGYSLLCLFVCFLLGSCFIFLGLVVVLVFYVFFKKEQWVCFDIQNKLNTYM